MTRLLLTAAAVPVAVCAVVCALWLWARNVETFDLWDGNAP